LISTNQCWLLVLFAGNADLVDIEKEIPFWSFSQKTGQINYPRTSTGRKLKRGESKTESYIGGRFLISTSRYNRNGL
jgi:hypothetical protein